MTEPDIALEQVHFAPVDDSLVHTMSAFCPCFPALAMEQAEFENGCPGAQVITYRHNQISDTP